MRELVEAWGYTAHIRSRGEESIPGYRARRWVVLSWLNRFRRLLIRWEKKVENYLAMRLDYLPRRRCFRIGS